jgi:hypothetical protein
MAKRPTVNARPVAQAYAAPNERILEFSGPTGTGGLISIRAHDDGTVSVDLYRLDAGVRVDGIWKATPNRGPAENV